MASEGSPQYLVIEARNADQHAASFEKIWEPLQNQKFIPGVYRNINLSLICILYNLLYNNWI